MILLLRKGVYPYQYIDNSNRFKERELPEKNKFYSNLNVEVISDKDYDHAKNVSNIFNMKNRGNYYNLFVHSDTPLLLDVFEEYRKTCIKEYELDSCHFLSAPGL